MLGLVSGLRVGFRGSVGDMGRSKSRVKITFRVSTSVGVRFSGA